MPKRIPLITMAGLGATQFSNLGDGTIDGFGPVGGLFKNMQAGDWQGAIHGFARDELLTFTGYDVNNGSWNIMNAKGAMVLGASVVASKLLTKFAGNPFKAIPFIGNKVKF